MVIGRINAHPEEEREDDEEDDVDAVDEEDAILDEEVVSRHLVLWLSRGQKYLGVCCNKPPMFPQGPMAVMQEISWALSWPARTAAGAAGRSEAS